MSRLLNGDVMAAPHAIWIRPTCARRAGDSERWCWCNKSGYGDEPKLGYAGCPPKPDDPAPCDDMKEIRDRCDQLGIRPIWDR